MKVLNLIMTEMSGGRRIDSAEAMAGQLPKNMPAVFTDIAYTNYNEALSSKNKSGVCIPPGETFLIEGSKFLIRLLPKNEDGLKFIRTLMPKLEGEKPWSMRIKKDDIVKNDGQNDDVFCIVGPSDWISDEVTKRKGEEKRQGKSDAVAAKKADITEELAALEAKKKELLKIIGKNYSEKEEAVNELPEGSEERRIAEEKLKEEKESEEKAKKEYTKIVSKISRISKKIDMLEEKAEDAASITNAGLTEDIAALVKTVNSVFGKKNVYIELPCMEPTGRTAKFMEEMAGFTKSKTIAVHVSEIACTEPEHLYRASIAEADRNGIKPKPASSIKWRGFTDEKDAVEALSKAIGESNSSTAANNASSVIRTLKKFIFNDEGDSGTQTMKDVKQDLLSLIMKKNSSIYNTNKKEIDMGIDAMTGAEAESFIAFSDTADKWKTATQRLWYSNGGIIGCALGLAPYRPNMPASENGPDITIAEGKKNGFIDLFEKGHIVRLSQRLYHTEQTALKAAAVIQSHMPNITLEKAMETADRIAGMLNEKSLNGIIQELEPSVEKETASMANALVGICYSEIPSDTVGYMSVRDSLRSEPELPYKADTGFTNHMSRVCCDKIPEGCALCKIRESKEALAADIISEEVWRNKGISKHPADIHENTAPNRWKFSGILFGGRRMILEKIKGMPFDKALPYMNDFLKTGDNDSSRILSSAFSITSMKEEFPVEFMTAVMRIAKPEKREDASGECLMSNIRMEPLNINRCDIYPHADGNHIKPGLCFVDSVNAEEIIKNRGNGYSCIQDFVIKNRIGINAFKNLVKAGAFDDFSDSRKAILIVSEKFIKLGARIHELEDKIIENTSKLEEGGLSKKETGILSKSLVYEKEELKKTKTRLDSIEIPSGRTDSLEEKTEMEKQVLFYGISAHPLDRYEWMAKGYEKIGGIKEGEKVRLLVVVSDIKEKISKNGNNYAVFNISDKTGKMECFCPPGTYKKVKELLVEGAVLVVIGEYNRENKSETTLTAIHIKIPASIEKQVIIAADNEKCLPDIKNIIEIYEKKGGSNVLFYDRATGKIIKTDIEIDPDVFLEDKLSISKVRKRLKLNL